jgi:peptidoglycan/xylan/chitin deacetylase (PgdA/CDA1 family)
MDQLATSLSSGNWSLLPEKPLIMTFDDGHVGNKFLFEVLKKYNVPSIIYVVAGVINTKRRFWFSLASVQSQTIAKLRLVDDAVRRAILRCDYCHTDEREYQERDALNTEELNRFITTGGTVGCHTMFHPFLTKCSKETAMLELKESKKILEQLCNCSIKHFAYPDGAWDNTARGWVQDVGFITARTTDSDWVTPNSDLLALPNFGINDDAGLSKMIVQTSGLWVLLKCFATYFRGT